MKAYQYIILVIITLVQSVNIYAQELKTGDKFPNLIIRGLFNEPSDSMDLLSIKSKLIILDFWGIGCVSCLKSFPKLDSIQRHFKDDVQIILINKESKDSTLRYLAKLKHLRIPQNVPFLFGDTTLHRLFPHDFVPHVVWLDSNKTIVSVTYGQNTTIANIRNYLQHKPLVMLEKKDTVNKERKESELWLAQTALNSNALPYYSYIAKFIPGTHGGSGIGSNVPAGPITQIYIEGGTILEFYTTAFAEWYKYPFILHSNSVELNVSNPSKYLPPKDINQLIPWIVKNGYSYGLRVPDDKAPQFFNFMKNDLNRYFGLKARIAKKKISCITVCSIRQPLIRKDHAQEDTLNYLHMPWSRLSWQIKMRLDFDGSPEPFINLCDKKLDFDVSINKQNWEGWDYKNLKPLQEELERYGIIISKRPYTTEVLFISE